MTGAYVCMCMLCVQVHTFVYCVLVCACLCACVCACVLMCVHVCVHIYAAYWYASAFVLFSMSL